jgi:hypothetical protein
MRKQHLGTFTMVPGLLESLGLDQRASNVASILRSHRARSGARACSDSILA